MFWIVFKNDQNAPYAVVRAVVRVIFFFFFLFDTNAKSVRVTALSIALISTPLSQAAGFNLKPLSVFRRFRSVGRLKPKIKAERVGKNIWII